MDADRKAYLRRHSSARLVQECLDGIDIAEAKANQAHGAARDAIRAADALRVERDAAHAELAESRRLNAQILGISEKVVRAPRYNEQGLRIMQDGPQA